MDKHQKTLSFEETTNRSAIILCLHKWIAINWDLRQVCSILIMSIIVERFWTFHEAFLQKLMKSLVCVFHVYILHQMNALKKLREMLFILPKKLFSLSRYSHFCIFPFPFFPPVYHCLDYRKSWFKKNPKVHHFIKCLDRNLKTKII